MVPCPQVLEMEVASIMKGSYDHFMQKEIHEQPESLAQTLMGRIKVRTRRRSFDRTKWEPSAAHAAC
jgi:glucosamine 6-phosphate synthetase-like amidotransferase/phosphosugar isomerase protein